MFNLIRLKEIDQQFGYETDYNSIIVDLPNALLKRDGFVSYRMLEF